MGDPRLTGSGTDTITITLSAALPDATLLTVTALPAAFLDQAGNAFGGLSITGDWTFRTEDLTPPVLNVVSPANGAVGVAVENLVVALTFNEPVVPGTGKLTVTAAVQGTLAEVSAADAAVVNVSIPGSPNEVRVALGAAGVRLPDIADITVSVDAAAFQDEEGNAFTDQPSWTFTTGDFTPPYLLSLNPAVNATRVSKAADLVLTFSEPGTPTAGQSVTVLTAAGAVVQAVDAADAAVTGGGTAEIVVDLPTNLADSTQFFVVIPGAAFTDGRLNPFPGIALGEWGFTIGDFLPPLVTTLDPAPGGAGASTRGNYTVTFNEPVAVKAGGSFRAYAAADDTLLDIVDVESTTLVFGSGTTALRFRPQASLPDSTDVYLTLDAGAVDDLSGNAFGGVPAGDWASSC